MERQLLMAFAKEMKFFYFIDFEWFLRNMIFLLTFNDNVFYTLYIGD